MGGLSIIRESKREGKSFGVESAMAQERAWNRKSAQEMLQLNPFLP